MGLVLFVSLACTGKSNGNAKPQESPCAKTREHVEALYRAELGRPDESDGAAPADVESSVADNTAMMLADCERDPQRFAPCLKAAVSVQQMERDCLVPLDDEGTVEGRTFKPE